MKKLPIGTQSFDILRNTDCVYVGFGDITASDITTLSLSQVGAAVIIFVAGFLWLKPLY
jgi:hypothetical protein